MNSEDEFFQIRNRALEDLTEIEESTGLNLSALWRYLCAMADKIRELEKTK